MRRPSNLKITEAEMRQYMQHALIEALFFLMTHRYQTFNRII